jgi:predicted NUDIX family NTP pyrophosphohydrolase
VYRRRPGRLEVLLGHPGGPYWAGKDDGVWSIPKGGLHPGEEALAAAIREFQEETGFTVDGPFIPLGSVILKSGKRVHAWAAEGDCDPGALVSTMCTLEWPPRSGRRIDVPELDRVQFFQLDDARRAVNPAQVPLLDTLDRIVHR